MARHLAHRACVPSGEASSAPQQDGHMGRGMCAERTPHRARFDHQPRGPSVVLAAGAGELEAAGRGESGAGAVTGVTVTPITLPVIFFFWTLPRVPRAWRVAMRLALAAAFSSGVCGVGVLRGARRKSARTS